MQDEPTDRFIAVIKNIGLCNVPYGILRTAAIRKTSMFKAFPGADLVFIAELANYGKFFEVQERLFFRRFHEEASSWARQDADHQAHYFHSAKTRKVQLIQWRSYIAYFLAAYRAPNSLSQKLKVYMFLLRGVAASWRKLAIELLSKLSGK
jgi:hypothetical protein